MVKMSNGDGVVLTVRLIRSFEHRNIRHIVFKNVDLNQTTQEFMENINRGIPCFVLSWKCRVPTRPGKPGKMRVHLENLEISWNFEKFNKYHGKIT